ncbi:MAG: sulfotransferase [Porticoccaceae bacterium]|nr:sulfotransferase [Porticoccaceae bacterium]
MNKPLINPLLFSPVSIKTAVEVKPPIIVVGLPRSGSSFLSDILSQLQDLYVFDDLYLYREAKAIGADTGYLTESQLESLLFFLGWQIRARIKHGTFSIPMMTIDDVEVMNSALRQLYTGKKVRWFELLEEWMMRLAVNQGAIRWGYKAPQDFLNVEMLKELFPGVKFIFIQRDPREMMRSLKYVHDMDGNPKQYHPIAYSLYWKSCAKKMMKLNNQNGDFLAVKFENMIKYPSSVIKGLAEYIGVPAPDSLEVKKRNSSFQEKEKKDLSSTEIWIIERIIGRDLRLCGYQPSYSQPTVRGFCEVLKVSIIFLSYQISRIFTKKSAMVSVRTFLRSIFLAK